MRGIRLWLLILLFSGAGSLRAHTVPTLEVEAEFTPARGITLHVNVDARLFLAAQPSTLPPVPATWWLDQDEASRGKTMAEARAYVARTLFFTVGGSKLEVPWKVIAIDSNTMLPLSPASAEAHLLCDYQGVLLEVAGPFKVQVADNCAVGVILLNSLEGNDQRYPQSLFPGESSRAFPLPALAGAPAIAVAEVKENKWWESLAVPRFVDLMLSAILAAVLAGVLGGRFLAVLWMLLVFHAAQIPSALAVELKWLHAPPEWMAVVVPGVLVAGVGILVLPSMRRRMQMAFVAIAVAGGCAGWTLGAHPVPWAFQPMALLLWRDAVLLLVQMIVAAVVCLACKAQARFIAANVKTR